MKPEAVQGFAAQPLQALRDVDLDVLLHFAYATQERVDESGDAAYVQMNVSITATVAAFIEAKRPAFVAYASPGAATRAEVAGLDVVRDPYGTLKVLDKHTLRQACHGVDARSLVMRVFNVAGPWMQKADAFALGNLINWAAAGPITTIRAAHPVVRSYVDVEDIAGFMLAVACSDASPADLTVETVGHEQIELGELAVRVRAAMGLPPGTVKRSWNPTAPPDHYVGTPEPFVATLVQLGLALRPLDEQIRRTADGLATQKK